jgi:hypothetical protein
VREGPLLAVWAIVTLALTAGVLWRAESRAVDDPVQKAARGEVTGLGALSLVREERLAAGLRKVRERWPDGRIVGLRVEPTRADLSVRTPDFVVHQVRIDAGLGLDESSTSEGVEEGLAEVPAGAPERILRAVNRRTGTAPEDVDYVNLTGGAENPGWFLKLERGTRPDRRDYVARLDGTGVRGNWEPAR